MKLFGKIVLIAVLLITAAFAVAAAGAVAGVLPAEPVVAACEKGEAVLDFIEKEKAPHKIAPCESLRNFLHDKELGQPAEPEPEAPNVDAKLPAEVLNEAIPI